MELSRGRQVERGRGRDLHALQVRRRRGWNRGLERAGALERASRPVGEARHARDRADQRARLPALGVLLEAVQPPRAAQSHGARRGRAGAVAGDDGEAHRIAAAAGVFGDDDIDAQLLPGGRPVARQIERGLARRDRPVLRRGDLHRAGQPVPRRAGDRQAQGHGLALGAVDALRDDGRLDGRRRRTVGRARGDPVLAATQPVDDDPVAVLASIGAAAVDRDFNVAAERRHGSPGHRALRHASSSRKSRPVRCQAARTSPCGVGTVPSAQLRRPGAGAPRTDGTPAAVGETAEHLGRHRHRRSRTPSRARGSRTAPGSGSPPGMHVLPEGGARVLPSITAPEAMHQLEGALLLQHGCAGCGQSRVDLEAARQRCVERRQRGVGGRTG